MKLIVAACNAATSAALPALQEALRVPIVGVLVPEAHAAVQATRNRRIGLLATEATVASGRYEEVVHALDAGAQVVSVACPRLVPLIEAGGVGEELDAAVREYAAPLKEDGRRHGHPRLHALPDDPPRLRAGVRARDDARLLGGGDRARGRRDAGPQGGRERPGPRRRDAASSRPGRREEFRTLGERFLQLPIPRVEQVTVRELELAAA